MCTSPNPKKVLITGANGQDGAYLVERLIGEGHEVHGLSHSEAGAAALSASFPRVTTHVSDLADTAGMVDLMTSLRPTHVFNLAGNTSVARSWQFPTDTADVLGLGPIRLLEAAWNLRETSDHPVRFLQASSAEIFGDATVVPQAETTPRNPVTPYGVAKSFAHEMVGVYRARGLFASSAILYNHESPRRPQSFVSRKISREAAKIALGLAESITLGNIDVQRDWGYAPDYVDAMIRVLDAPEAGDYVVATGVAHSVRQFIETAFDYLGIQDWTSHVTIDHSLYRPADPKQLVGDSSKLRAIGWKPSVDFEQLVHIMVEADLADLRDAGH